MSPRSACLYGCFHYVKSGANVGPTDWLLVDLVDHGPNCPIDGFATTAGFEHDLIRLHSGNKWQQMATSPKYPKHPQN